MVATGSSPGVLFPLHAVLVEEGWSYHQFGIKFNIKDTEKKEKNKVLCDICEVKLMSVCVNWVLTMD